MEVFSLLGSLLFATNEIAETKRTFHESSKAHDAYKKDGWKGAFYANYDNDNCINRYYFSRGRMFKSLIILIIMMIIIVATGQYWLSIIPIMFIGYLFVTMFIRRLEDYSVVDMISQERCKSHLQRCELPFKPSNKTGNEPECTKDDMTNNGYFQAFKDWKKRGFNS